MGGVWGVVTIGTSVMKIGAFKLVFDIFLKE